MDEESFIKQQLASIQRKAQAEAEPWMKRLSEIYAQKAPPPIIVTREMLGEDAWNRLKEMARG
jgi:hypothetical protein